MKRTESAGGVVVNPKGEVLVVNQRGNSWSLPKGHVDPGEDLLTAARREIAEESGITELEFVRKLGIIERHRIGRDGGEDLSELKLIHLFLFRTGQVQLQPQDPQNPEALWIQPQHVADLLTHPKDKAFVLNILPSI
jgi:ADP-ribose pyrophosphatase YjhB (NUDIX family)